MRLFLSFKTTSVVALSSSVLFFLPKTAISQVGFTPMVIKSTLPRTCQDLYLEGKRSNDSGVYLIDPDDYDGPLAPIEASCEFIDPGNPAEGGWTLILNYVHKGGTNPALFIRSSSLPLLGGGLLGSDESGSTYWGHAAPAYLSQIPFERMRWYCQTSAHNRKMHFITASETAIQYAKTGQGIDMMSNVESNATLLSDHSAYWADNRWFDNQGDLALTQFPFYKGGTYHWGIRGLGNRWECDDYPRNTNYSTIHRIWVKKRAHYQNCKQILQAGLSNGDGMYTIDPDYEMGATPPFRVFCDMSSDGGGWTLIASSTTSSPGISNVVTELSSINQAGILSEEKIVDLANASENVRITGDGKKVVSKTSYPISRIGIYHSLSDANSTSGSTHWSGDTSYLDYSCPGNSSNLNTSLFHACGNNTGLHWNGYNRYEWDFAGVKNNLNLWIR